MTGFLVKGRFPVASRTDIVLELSERQYAEFFLVSQANAENCGIIVRVEIDLI